MPVQLVREQPRQEAHRLLLAGRVHPRAPPGPFRGLDDEGGLAARVVLVGVHAPQPVVVLAEVEGEGGEGSRRAQPDEAVRPQVDRRLEGLREAFADRAVDPVGADHEVGVQVGRCDIRLEVQTDPHLAAAALQQQQQRPPRQPREAVPRRPEQLALVMDVDVVPMVEALLDRAQRRRVGFGHFVERGVREDDAEAECVVRSVALEDLDGPRRVGLLEEQRGEEAARASADHVDSHRPESRTSPPPMIRCWISVVPS